MTDPLSSFRAEWSDVHGFWPKLDVLLHRAHLPRWVTWYPCYRADLKFGLTKSEAKQAYR